MTHALERTSQKGPGKMFVGRCMKCGQEGLLMRDALEPCPADEAVSDKQALIDAIKKDQTNE